MLYHGSQEDRQLIREFEFSYLSRPKSAGYKMQVVVTSYEMAMQKDNAKGCREMSQIFWEMMIIDEAHKLKNYNSKLSVTLREEYKCRNKLLLTGTPLQNNTVELWSLLNFIDSDVFASLYAFQERYGDLKDSEKLIDLQVVSYFDAGD